MEDSEQRKKRLKEMRMQADTAEVSGDVKGSGMPGLLSNPLIEASSITPSNDQSYASPRFDFYTDPMNAFSSNKRNNAHIQSAPDYYPPQNFARSPLAQFSSPHPASTNPHIASSPTQVSPAPYRNPVWNRPRGPSHYNLPFCPSSSGTYPSPRFQSSDAPLYNYGQGQGLIHRPSHIPNHPPGYRSSPSPSTGRGRGFWHNTRSPVPGRGGGRGSSSHGHWSNEGRASGLDRFCKMSMVEDPWKLLIPVIWKATNSFPYTPGCSKPWTSKSISTKREGSSAAPVKPASEPSLAEYLAAALNEAVTGDAENIDAENV